MPTNDEKRRQDYMKKKSEKKNPGINNQDNMINVAKELPRER